MKKNSKRNGSALVVVLGMLAVLMLMAIAFSVFMRTERSGTTNLRHALVAKQTMQTAISQVMESIDRSFENPTNNWPVPDWDPPYLTSKTASPYFQKGTVCPAGERKDNARVLTEEISRHLTPSQLALARAAKTEWTPIFSSVAASEVDTRGRPSLDQIVGRYAFIALNTTGLLDMNLAGGGLAAERLVDYGTNSVNFQIAGSTFVKEYSNFLKKRADNGGFTSYADLWRMMGIGDYLSDPDSFVASSASKPYELKPELFRTFSTSLEELAPDGSMKIPLAEPASAQKAKHVERTYKAFQQIFKDDTGADKDKTFQGVLCPSVKRSEIATQALIDYVDEDDVSSGGIATGKDSGTGYLNYPCTEPVPMVSQVISFFEVEKNDPVETAANKADWYQEYAVSFTLYCEAYFMNNEVPENLAGKKYNLKIEYEFSDFESAFGTLWGAGTKAGGWEKVGDYGPILNRTAESGLKTIGTASANARCLTAGFNTGDLGAFKIRAYAKVDPATGSVTYRKFSKLEEAGSTAASIRTEIRVSAEVLNETGATVQKVPAPALENQKVGDFRMRVDPGLYHKAGERAGDTDYEYGWAFCIDPRFAYNTQSMVSFAYGGYAFWICNNDILPTEDIMTGGNQKLKDVATAMEGVVDDQMIDKSQYGNYLINRILFVETDKTEAKKLADAFSRPSGASMEVYPDSFHSATEGGDIFMETDTLLAARNHRIANQPMVTAAELGNLVIGPWETLSLFASFHPAGDVGKFDFHRAVDYFGVGEPRFPAIADIPASGIGTIDKEHFPAVYSGRLNLNAQRIVEFVDEEARDAFIGDTGDVLKYNYEPLTAVLTGARVNGDAAASKSVTPAIALEMAMAFYDDTDLATDPTAGNAVMIRRVSDFGNRNEAGDESPVLGVLQANESALEINCDAHRESLLASTLNALTTRGQTYTVILRADAYSPKYGSESTGDGTTMATTHALVELWRDPEPARRPDGQLFPLINGSPTDTPAHNWYVRSLRWF